MFGIIFLVLTALLMISVYMRTRKPKLFAAVNSAAGIALFAAVKLFTAGTFTFSAGSAGICAILGVPGAFLYIFFEQFFGKGA